MGISAIRDLLVGFTKDDDRASCAVPYALGLAREAGAHVTIQGISSRIVVSHVLASDLARGLVTDDNRRRLTLVAQAAEEARLEASARGIRCSAQSTQLPMLEASKAFGAQARVHDLTVLDRPSDLLSFPRALVEEVLFASGRPAIVLPEGSDTFRLGHAMVAWDGSAQAARAIGAAMPLLQAAESVTIVAVAEEEKGSLIAGAEIAPHFARHGIEADLLDLDTSGRDAAQTLRAQAHTKRTDLIVMGAFVHSWWRQVTLGGVTEAFLDDPPAPLFLCH